LKQLLAFLISLIIFKSTECQVWVSGRVYDTTRMVSIPAVKVSSKFGVFTFTDSIGRYGMMVEPTDSIFFSYRGKSTTIFPVKDIRYPAGFDIALQVRVQDRYQTLKEVVVIGKSYRQDSLENREKYAKVFNFDKGGLRISETGSTGGTPGLDLTSLIESFRFRRNKTMKSFQNRLIEEEQEKFINNRFTKTLVKQITGLENRDLEKFMVVYRPPYEFTSFSTDYEFHKYILDASRYFKQGILPKMKNEERLKNEK